MPADGTDNAADVFLFPPLPDVAALHACLICGAVIAAAGVQFHDEWHRNVSAAAIAAERRLDELAAVAHHHEGGTRA